MRTEEDNLIVINDIQEAYKDGKIIFMTEEGPRGIKLEDFIKQGVDGMLYDLNRGPEVIATLAKTSKNLRYVNDFACAYTIKYIMKQLELKDAEIDNLRNQLEEANKELQEVKREYGEFAKDPFSKREKLNVLEISKPKTNETSSKHMDPNRVEPGFINTGLEIKM